MSVANGFTTEAVVLALVVCVSGGFAAAVEAGDAWPGTARGRGSFDIVYDHTASGGPKNPDGQPSDDGYVNAFDTIYRSAYLNGLRNRLDDVFSYSGFMAALANAVSNLPPPFSWAAPEITVVVHFNDGSERRFGFDTMSVGFMPIANTAIDAHHNLLPEGAPTHPCRYRFGGPSSVAPYDSRNLLTLFPVGSNAEQIPGQCGAVTWDGQALHCQDLH